MRKVIFTLQSNLIDCDTTVNEMTVSELCELFNAEIRKDPYFKEAGLKLWVSDITIRKVK